MNTDELQIPWLKSDRPIKIAVVGDVILDEYLEGQVNRISPEAPVPVHRVSRTIHTPGGAANAARNVKLAGGDVELISVLGNDESGRVLRKILDSDGIDDSGLITVTDRPTVRKTRLTSSRQQMVRIDWEEIHPISEESQNKIIDKLEKMDFDALLISDYGKGALPIRLLANILELAKKKKKPAVVDPKGRDYSKYLHATLITPNRSEACDALGVDPNHDWSGEELGRRLQKTFGVQNVLVTMGPKGMVMVPAAPDGHSDKTIVLPAIAKEVYDVSGAGDTVVALMTLALGAKASLELSMKLANTAAAVVVEKWGTQPITLAELEAALCNNPDLEKQQFSTESKIKVKESLIQVIKDPKARNRRIVFTNGCFDLMHAGHVSYLEEARALGDALVVAVNSDSSVKRLKGASRPLVSLQNRMRMLASMACIDYVVPFDEDTPQELIEFLVPDVLVKGADYKKKDIVGADVVTNAGGVVDTIAFVQGLSTSQLIEKIKEN
jgi:D-beta-D-heptose 7-phosphate kinase / D-beta-D-heptose 1-phosphate adenosyltransferase